MNNIYNIFKFLINIIHPSVNKYELISEALR